MSTTAVAIEDLALFQFMAPEVRALVVASFEPCDARARGRVR